MCPLCLPGKSLELMYLADAEDDSWYPPADSEPLQDGHTLEESNVVRDSTLLVFVPADPLWVNIIKADRFDAIGVLGERLVDGETPMFALRRDQETQLTGWAESNNVPTALWDQSWLLICAADGNPRAFKLHNDEEMELVLVYGHGTWPLPPLIDEDVVWANKKVQDAEAQAQATEARDGAASAAETAGLAATRADNCMPNVLKSAAMAKESAQRKPPANLQVRETADAKNMNTIDGNISWFAQEALKPDCAEKAARKLHFHFQNKHLCLENVLERPDLIESSEGVAELVNSLPQLFQAEGWEMRKLRKAASISCSFEDCCKEIQTCYNQCASRGHFTAEHCAARQ